MMLLKKVTYDWPLHFQQRAPHSYMITNWNFSTQDSIKESMEKPAWKVASHHYMISHLAMNCLPVLVVNCIKIYCHSQIKSAFIAEIPEDPFTAEEYYNDAFDSCSETSEESDREQEEKNVSQTVCRIYPQVYSL